jgi:ribonuclease P protein component
MSQSFGPAVRLRASAEFAVVQKTGRRVPGRYVTVLVKPNVLGHDRLGIIASRRLGNAVVRNRAKRRVREIFRQELSTPANSTPRAGVDFIVIPRREAASMPFAGLHSDLASALRKARDTRDRGTEPRRTEAR